MTSSIAIPQKMGASQSACPTLDAAHGFVGEAVEGAMLILVDVIWNNVPRSILDPFPVQVQSAKSAY